MLLMTPSDYIEKFYLSTVDPLCSEPDDKYPEN